MPRRIANGYSAWSLTAGSLPQCSYFLPLPAEPEIIHDIEASLWAPYTDSGEYVWF